MPLPLVSMTSRFFSIPPQTFGICKPACSATSKYWTEDDARCSNAASTTIGFCHLQIGVVRASRSVPPRATREEPRKRLRDGVMGVAQHRGRPERQATTRSFERLQGLLCSSVARLDTQQLSQHFPGPLRIVLHRIETRQI